jgi:NADH-quinone oxidoreductase subunit F
VDVAWAEAKIARFFAHESCGKCTPCREGTYWMKHLFDRVIDGRAVAHDVDLLHAVGTSIRGKCLCALGEFAALAAVSGVERFRADFDARVNGR